MDTSHEDQYTFLIISRSNSPQNKKKCFGQKLWRKSKQTILCSITFFFENRVVYEIMGKNTVEVTDDNMAHAHCVLHD